MSRNRLMRVGLILCLVAVVGLVAVRLVAALWLVPRFPQAQYAPPRYSAGLRPGSERPL